MFNGKTKVLALATINSILLIAAKAVAVYIQSADSLKAKSIR
jgi:hypothetical protein